MRSRKRPGLMVPMRPVKDSEPLSNYGMALSSTARAAYGSIGLRTYSPQNIANCENLVDSLERPADKGLLDGTAIWMFTDNSVAEAAFFCGSSKSREVNNLVLRLCRLHVVVIPRLLTALWRNQLEKITDVMLTVPLGCPAWQADNLEPLILLRISLPLSHLLPWRFRNTPAAQDVEHWVPQMWSTSFGDIGRTLRKLLRKARSLSSL